MSHTIGIRAAPGGAPPARLERWGCDVTRDVHIGESVEKTRCPSHRWHNSLMNRGHDPLIE